MDKYKGDVHYCLSYQSIYVRTYKEPKASKKEEEAEKKRKASEALKKKNKAALKEIRAQICDASARTILGKSQ